MIELDHPDLPSIARDRGVAAAAIQWTGGSGESTPAPGITLNPMANIGIPNPLEGTASVPLPNPVPLGYLSTWTLPVEFYSLDTMGLVQVPEPRNITRNSFFATLNNPKEIRFLTPQRVEGHPVSLRISYKVPSFVAETYTFLLPESLSGAQVFGVQVDGLLYDKELGSSYGAELRYKQTGDLLEIYQGRYRLAAQASVIVSVSHSLTLSPQLVVLGYPLASTGISTPIEINAFTYTFGRGADLYRPKEGDLLWDSGRRMAIVFLPMTWEFLLYSATEVPGSVHEVASEIGGI